MMIKFDDYFLLGGAEKQVIKEGKEIPSQLIIKFS